MKNFMFFTFGIALIATVTSAFAQNFTQINQSSPISSPSPSPSVVIADNSNMSSYSSTSTSQYSDGSSSYQRSTLSLSSSDLKKPHILSIDTSGVELKGEIAVDGKVVKRINDKKTEINLSPYLSVGEHTVKISGRYAPATSSISVELSGPSTSVTQQTSGNGVLNHIMTVNVR